MTALLELAALSLSLANEKTLQRIVCSKPQNTAVLRTVATLCVIKGALCLQFETFCADGKAMHENLPIKGLDATRLAQKFEGFSQINLFSTGGNCEFRKNKKGNAVLLGAGKIKQGGEIEIGGNDKQKKHILTGNEPFLRLLGVSDANGRVYDKKGAKFRQINRFLELVRDTLPALPQGGLRIADLCCGKSYLSFAVYHYFANVLGYTVEMVGVDLKKDVIETCNDVAQKLGFSGLRFVAGDVGKYEMDGQVDLVVSLHACDTATDLVLDKAIAWGAKVILSTPCCHHELNHTLNCPTLGFLAEHSMLRQKFCDAATDALRLKRLESVGYETAALELIDPDDTPKNIMLRAILRPKTDRDAKREQKAAAQYRAARAFLLGETE